MASSTRNIPSPPPSPLTLVELLPSSMTSFICTRAIAEMTMQERAPFDTTAAAFQPASVDTGICTVFDLTVYPSHAREGFPKAFKIWDPVSGIDLRGVKELQVEGMVEEFCLDGLVLVKARGERSYWPVSQSLLANLSPTYKVAPRDSDDVIPELLPSHRQQWTARFYARTAVGLHQLRGLYGICCERQHCVGQHSTLLISGINACLSVYDTGDLRVLQCWIGKAQVRLAREWEVRMESESETARTRARMERWGDVEMEREDVVMSRDSAVNGERLPRQPASVNALVDQRFWPAMGSCVSCLE